MLDKVKSQPVIPAEFVNPASEAALLGAVLLNNEAIYVADVSTLKPEHFGEEIHDRIFAEMQRKIALGQSVSPRTLRDSFPDVSIIVRADTNEKFTVPQYLARLAAEATSVLLAPSYARDIIYLWGVRQLAASLRDLTDNLWSRGAPDVAFERCLNSMDEIRLAVGGKSKASIVSVGDATNELATYMARQYESQGKASDAVMSGLALLDHKLGGFKSGELITLAGRPGMGKSTLGMSIARQAATKGFGIGVFSLEMPLVQVTARLVADQLYSTSGVYTPYADLLRGENITPDIYERVIDVARKKLDQLPLELDASSRLSVTEIAAKARSMQKRLRLKGADLRLLVVDYLKFVQPMERYRGNKVLEVGEITGALKQLAKDMEIPIILICQLNRTVENREDKHPQLSDLRDSGEIEQDSDVVLLCYREAYYLQQMPNSATDDILQAQLVLTANVLDVSIAKQRNGPTGSIRLFVDMGAGAVRNSRNG